MKQRGFSLLELLVVIGIVSILLAIAISSFSTAQKKSRDAKRQADLRTIQQAAEQYYSICNYVYPTFSAGVRGPIICTNPSQAIIPTDKLPFDPKSTTPYLCKNGSTCNTSEFTLCATPELGGTICVSNQQ